MTFFDFLKWVLEDFWRFCGVVVLLAVVGQIIVAGAAARGGSE